MIRRKIFNLNSATPQGEQDRLEANLRAIYGVDRVVVHTSNGEISYWVRDKLASVKAAVDLAVSGAGFGLGSRS